MQHFATDVELCVGHVIEPAKTDQGAVYGVDSGVNETCIRCVPDPRGDRAIFFLGAMRPLAISPLAACYYL